MVFFWKGIVDLIIKICGGQASKFQISGKKEYKPKTIILNTEKFKTIIGFNITPGEIKKILSSLGFSLKLGKRNIKVQIPTWRPDITQDIDLIEELIRIKGFDKIETIEPKKIRSNDTLDYRQKIFHLSQRAISNKGYLEAVTWSFTDKKIDELLSGKKSIEILKLIS